MRGFLANNARTIFIAVVASVIASVATAGAANLITGRQIKNGTITAKDLSKAVRAQLAKAGTPGPQGATGPVEAVISSSSTPSLDQNGAPPGIASTAFNDVPITTTKRGRLLISVDVNAAAVDCNGGTSAMGIYLDGKPVPGSAIEVPGSVPSFTAFPTTARGITADPVEPGNHQVRLGLYCFTGTYKNGWTKTPQRVTAIVLGN